MCGKRQCANNGRVLLSAAGNAPVTTPHPTLCRPAAGGTLELSGCTFRNLVRQAIEVREGGSLDASHVAVDHCYQGVSAYGGARSVTLRHCTFADCTKEGVLLRGTFENAATAAQQHLPGVARPTATASQR